MDKVFVNGMIVKEAKPDFVLCRLSVKVDDFGKFMLDHADGDWLNIDVKQSKNGKLYAELDTWKPKQEDDPF